MVTISNGKEKLYAVMRHTYTHADMLKDKTNARDKKCSQFPEGFFFSHCFICFGTLHPVSKRARFHIHTQCLL